MKQGSGSGKQGGKGSGGGSKFLPGGGNGGNKSQRIQNQTSRTLHTNPSHIGGRGGK